MLLRVTGLIFLLCLLHTSTVQSHNKNISHEKLLWSLLKPKIYKGEPAALGEIPYQVAFKHIEFGQKDYLTFCGGTIIKQKVVLSAAHCFVVEKPSLINYCTGRLSRKHYKKTYAVAGNVVNRIKFSDFEVVGQWKRIRSIAYIFIRDSDDIAVVHLTSPYTFDKNVAPIPYARITKDYVGLRCLASGYGMTLLTTLAENLQKAYLEIMPEKKCNELSQKKMSKYVCTVATLQSAFPLMFDSGGPLVCRDTGDPAEKDKGLLVGVLSGGLPLRLSSFTRVTSFLKFIEHNNANVNRAKFKLHYLLLLLLILL